MSPDWVMTGAFDHISLHLEGLNRPLNQVTIRSGEKDHNLGSSSVQIKLLLA